MRKILKIILFILEACIRSFSQGEETLETE